MNTIKAEFEKRRNKTARFVVELNRLLENHIEVIHNIDDANERMEKIKAYQAVERLIERYSNESKDLEKALTLYTESE